MWHGVDKREIWGHNGSMNYDDLMAHYGSFARAAKALGKTRQAVHRYKKNGIPLPVQYQFQVITRGKVRVKPRKTA